MEINSKKKIGSYTTTYKIRFYINEIEFLKLTQEIYNEIIQKYYDLIFKYPEVLELSRQKCLRELEKLTIISVTKDKPKEYFELDAPTELRRAAINQAIGLAKSYNELLKMSEESNKVKAPNKAEKFNCSVTFYKGMYKNLEASGKVSIKLFDGKKWSWFNAKFKNWSFNENDEILSPTLVINKDYVMAHIPVKRKIDDVTPIKDRMKENDVRVCAVAFSNTDKPVTCVIVDKEGNLVKSLFVDGGSEYRDLISKILNRQKKNLSKNKNLQYEKKNHKKYREKSNRIVNHFSHVMSKKIVDFCLENDAKVIVTALSTKDKVYYHTKGDKSRPIYLREKITEYLNYKAYREGILSTTVLRKDKASLCYKCRGKIQNRNLKTVCENGHKLDYYFNYAMNIALDCLEKYKIKS